MAEGPKNYFVVFGLIKPLNFSPTNSFQLGAPGVAGSFGCSPSRLSSFVVFCSHLPGMFPNTVIPLCVADNVEVSANEMEVNEAPATADAGATTVVANGGNGREEIDPSQRWKSLETLLRRESPFGAETGHLAVGMYEPFEDVSSKMFPWPKAYTFVWEFLMEMFGNDEPSPWTKMVNWKLYNLRNTCIHKIHSSEQRVG